MDGDQAGQQVGDGILADHRIDHAGIEFRHVEQIGQQFAQAGDAIGHVAEQWRIARRDTVFQDPDINPEG